MTENWHLWLAGEGRRGGRTKERLNERGGAGNGRERCSVLEGRINETGRRREKFKREMKGGNKEQDS